MNFLIGADEVGYGSWAGPICVAAVRAPTEWHLAGLNDSKKLSRKNRELLSQQLWTLHHSGDISISVADACNQQIDRDGVAVVQRRLFLEVINNCACESATAVVDGKLILNKAILKVPYRSVIKADSTVSTVMAASIVAKVHRDTFMYQQEVIYPGYDFLHNVGYGTAKHQAGLKQLGPSKIHRMSYKPLQALGVT